MRCPWGSQFLAERYKAGVNVGFLLSSGREILITCKDSRLFLHLIEPLEGVEAISLPIDSIQQSGKLKVKSVKVMKDGKPLKYKVADGKLIITLDETPSDIDYVIEVLF